MITRQNTLDYIRQQPDVSVLIVGGGINGAGLFRELALQGIDVLLVEKVDFCSGASAAPSRMIHGGLRYLEFGEFRLVKEAVKERNLLLQNAPHYVNPLPTTIPIFSWFSGIGSAIRNFFRLSGARPSHRGALMVKMGLTLYDIFTLKQQTMPRHWFTSHAKSLAFRPQLNDKIVCTSTYYDAWISYPERLCLELILDGEALCPQARALNYVACLEGAGDQISLRDELTGNITQVKPQVVVNATGAWIDFTNQALHRQTKMIGGTKGSHLVIDNDELFAATQGEMVYYENADGRVALVLPWLGKVLIGSTDIKIDNPDQIRCDEAEVDYILSAVRQIFPTIQVDRSQIVATFVGVRPLPYTQETATVRISRDHSCPVIEPNGTVDYPIYSLIGGKWTTFRAFAELVTDQLLPRLGKTRLANSDELVIGGGKNFPKDDKAKHRWLDRLQESTNLSHERLATLLMRYGGTAERVAQFLTQGADQPLRFHPAYSYREIEYIICYERVFHLDDLILRRTSMALLGEVSSDLLGELADIMASLRNWKPPEIEGELNRTLKILQEKHGIELTIPSLSIPRKEEALL